VIMSIANKRSPTKTHGDSDGIKAPPPRAVLAHRESAKYDLGARGHVLLGGVETGLRG